MCAHYSNQAQLLQLFSALTQTLTQIHFNVNPFSEDFPAEARSFPFPTAFRFQSSATAAAEALAYFHY